MVALYKVSTGDLAKTSHHESMADVHADLGRHYSAMHSVSSKPAGENTPAESRQLSFYAAAHAHHSSEAHGNVTSALDKSDSRKFSSSFKETESNPGFAENNSYGLHPNRIAPHVTDHPITGDPQSFIPDDKLSRRRFEQLSKAHEQVTGVKYSPSKPEDTASNPNLKGRRFI